MFSHYTKFNIYLCKMQLLVFNLSKKPFVFLFNRFTLCNILLHEIYLKQSFTVIRAKIQRSAGLNGPVKVNNLVEKEVVPWIN